MKSMHLIKNTIDWVSVKLNMPCVVLLFVEVGEIMKLLGMVSVLSTIAYNGIRIYKEIREKNKTGM